MNDKINLAKYFTNPFQRFIMESQKKDPILVVVAIILLITIICCIIAMVVIPPFQLKTDKISINNNSSEKSVDNLNNNKNEGQQFHDYQVKDYSNTENRETKNSTKITKFTSTGGASENKPCCKKI
ncbi:hypothetical protein [uncultured Methanospirillum sp.]|uniref:hypothetical protein n=1 Tax=uncultured Methanospirillum sp. TaxID=262503 RepID=UPI0029C764D3|nr:hypothetical protein [uncultured Methanospirillum sp.]